LGAELARKGHEVHGLRRTADQDTAMAVADIKPVRGDVTRAADLESLPGPYDWIVNCVASGGGGAAEYRQVYLEGTRNLLNHLLKAPPKKYVYTSSTSVYGQTDGSAVKEESPTEPQSDTSRILVETEKLLIQSFQEHRLPTVILRLAGIYGPDRGYWFRQFLKNEARIEGHGERIMNMIHRDDVIGVIIEALESAHPGSIYNVVDEEPTSQLRFFHWLADSLGRHLPPYDPQPAAADAGKRDRSNKKVLNRRLKMELGYQFKYPTFREGLTVEIQRLEDAGLLSAEGVS
jgi:nucleoside-diphosphate-sugar epimerase